MKLILQNSYNKWTLIRRFCWPKLRTDDRFLEAFMV